jgi:hypothetical protein
MSDHDTEGQVRQRSAPLCIIRDVGWHEDVLSTVQEITIWADGSGRVARSPKFYNRTDAVDVEIAVPPPLLDLLEVEVKSGATFRLIEGVPTFVQGLGGSRVLL